MSEYLSVTVLTGYIKNIFDNEELLHNIKLAGEVSGIRCSGAHAYFTLKDANAQIDCTCFNYARTYLPKTGESVILEGGVDYYQRGGRLSFVARSIQPIGQGLLALQLEELKKRLAKAGYFDESHKKQIPLYPDRVCVITSKTGAVIRDIVSTVRRKNDILDIDVIDVKVQGEYAEKDIISALELADSLGYDVIIIARGGGSLEDLMPFNSERLVYKIFDMNTPVISAVGHETDVTLCDFASDLRVPTPTAAGERVGYDVTEVKARIVELLGRIKLDLGGKLETATGALSQVINRLIGSNKLAIAENVAKVRALAVQMSHAMDVKHAHCERRVSEIVERLNGNNPTKILSQGYARLYDSKGKNTDLGKMRIGDSVTVLTGDGRMLATVDSIMMNEK